MPAYKGSYSGATRGAAPALIVPPISAMVAGAAAWYTAEAATFNRFTVAVPTPFQFINMWVGTSSGNIQVGVASLAFANATTMTFTRVATSGTIAAPTGSTAAHIDLGSATTLTPGQYGVFLWVDNTTLTTTHGVTAGLQASRLCFNATLAGGVPASGTITASGRYVTGLTLEAA